MNFISGTQIGSTKATGAASISAGTQETYTFSPPVIGAFVSQFTSNPGTLRLVFNPASSDLASATNAEFELPSGVSAQAEAPEGLLVASVSVYSDLGSTYGTDFAVRGYKADA